MNKEINKLYMQSHIQKALECLELIYPEYELDNDHNKDTAKRIAKAWTEMCRGLGEMQFEFTTFPNDNLLSNNWIIKKDIEFSSICGHHFFPFFGKVSIGYVPHSRICGISKLDRVVDHFSKRPQVQENFGDEILYFLQEKLGTDRVVVIVESLHTCVACRGAESRNSTMLTTHSFHSKDLVIFKELSR